MAVDHDKVGKAVALGKVKKVKELCKGAVGEDKGPCKSAIKSAGIIAGSKKKSAFDTGPAAALGSKGALGKSLTTLKNQYFELSGANDKMTEGAQQLAAHSLKTAIALGKEGDAQKRATIAATAATQAMSIFLKMSKGALDAIEKYRIGLARAGEKDGPKFLASIAKQNTELASYGVRLKVLHKAQVEFRNNLVMMTKDAFDGGKELRKMAAINERFGISIEASTQMMNKLNLGFNATTKQTTKMSNQLLKFAKDTGQPFQKVWGDFNKGIEKFMYNMDPDKALKKFTVFQRLAREMGSDVGALVDVVDKFDDLETGMEFGGELNMLLSSLGGSFDSVQATLMSQPDRMKYIADQIKQVGGKIEGMTELGQRATIKQLSKTLGMDVAAVKAMLQKDIGADASKYMQNAENVQEMGVKEQKSLAQEQTSRAERVEQRNDLLVNNMTIKLEGIMQLQSRLQTRVYKEQIPRLIDKFYKHQVGGAGGPSVKSKMGEWEGLLTKLNAKSKIDLADFKRATHPATLAIEGVSEATTKAKTATEANTKAVEAQTVANAKPLNVHVVVAPGKKATVQQSLTEGAQQAQETWG